MQLNSIDEERSQDVENIMRPGEDHDYDYDEKYYVDSSKRGKKYYIAMVQQYKYLFGIIIVVIFTLSLAIGFSMSGQKVRNAQFDATEGVTEPIDSISDSNEKLKDLSFNDAPINSKLGWNADKDSHGVDESSTTGTTSNIATGRLGGTDVSDVSTPKSSLEFLDLLKRSFSEMNFPETHSSTLNSNQSPQSHAMMWMVENDTDELSDKRKLQRYALATFFYSTYAVTHTYLDSQFPWKSADKWLSSFNECEWQGITCDPNIGDGESVTSIVLADNRISGTPPLDLGLLGSTLETLVLSTNLIFMEDSDLEVLGYLTNLQDLKIDDNYISTKAGLPGSLQELENLKRVVMSYNLLQGQIPSDYFDNLSKLSHLEIESNYVSGSLPASLLQSESLIYLYMRRNKMSIKFDEIIQSSNWTKLFSLWIDSNDVTGTIPAEIDRMTGLASLSISNTTLSGTIPIGFGELTGLRRLWLYDNDLTGSIPEEVGFKLSNLEVVQLYDNYLTGEMPVSLCDTITKSTYQFKELSVDCDDVQCDCCKCYPLE